MKHNCIIIDPYDATVRYERVGTDTYALRNAILVTGGLDYGNLGGGLSIWVYEFGLIEYVPGIRFFTLANHQLYAGRAIITGHDEWGESVDVPQGLEPSLGVRFLGDLKSTRLAVENGEVDAPQVKVNGIVHWTWPDAYGTERVHTAIETTMKGDSNVTNHNDD